MKEIGVIILVIIGLIVLCGIGPLLTIASLNTLFGLNIAYTIWTWLSVAWMQFITFGSLGMAIRSLKK